MQELPTNNDAIALDALLNKLNTEYYDKIDVYIDNAKLQIAEIQACNKPQEETLFSSLATKLIGQAEQYIRLRRFALLPYINELLSKQKEGHDCRSCSGSCSIRHTAEISSIKESQKKIKETLYRVQSVAKPVFRTEDECYEAYMGLRNNMMQLDKMLTEIFYIEEAQLIPKLLEGQNNINAHD